MSTLENAILIATKAHYGQIDKHGEPYILHPLTVMQNVESESEKIVAVLHDVIEDTDVTLDDLEKEGFSNEVLEALNCITKKNGEDYIEYLARVKNNPLALKVKFADIKHNSCPQRLSKLDPEIANTLISKYKLALGILTEKNKPLNIYVGHSNSFDFTNELYNPIKSSSLAATHTFIFPHEEGMPFLRTKDILENCDLMIAEVSYPSTGLGIELGYADMHNVPILCIYKEGFKISSSLKIITNNLEQYSDTQEMIEIIRKYLTVKGGTLCQENSK